MAERFWRVGGTGGGFASRLSMDGRDVDIDERTVLASVERRLGTAWGVQLAAGAILDGELQVGGVRYDVGPGFAVAASASFLALPEEEVRPFILLALSMGVSTTTAGADRLTALDLRGSVVIGKTFAEIFTPYLVGRAFGGPVFWTIDGGSVVGGDTHHYAVGFGATLRLGAADVFAEWLPLGEQSVNAGVGLSF